MGDSQSTLTWHQVQVTTLAAVASRLCTHPLDTIKTRIQADQGQVQPNWRTVVRHTLTTEPVRSLYRGLPVALGFSIPALTTYLTTYEAVKEGLHQWSQRQLATISKDDHHHTVTSSSSPAGSCPTGLKSAWARPIIGLLSHHSMGNYAVSAMCAEMLSGLIWTPMEVMKNRLQVIRRTGPLGPEIPLRGGSHTLALASQIYRTQGIAGFFRGYWLSIAVFVPHTVIYFVTYEKLKSWWAHRWSPSQSSWDNPSAAGGKGNSVLASAPALAPPLPFYGYLTCASMACVLSASISNIFDVVKTKWQVNQVLGDRVSGSTVSPSSSAASSQAHRQAPRRVRELMRYMWRHEGGYRAFSRGMLARVIWMTPSVTISMTTYEWLKHHMFNDSISA
ncbi:hypothetical protein H4R33_005654 [Dimargaris cristalligena]|nr:hypothetical protein H4R33_005654 [Dimargaris cristalligena]